MTERPRPPAFSERLADPEYTALKPERKRAVLLRLRDWQRHEAETAGLLDQWAPHIDSALRAAAKEDGVEVEPGFLAGSVQDVVKGINQVRLAWNTAGSDDAEDIASITKYDAEHPGSLAARDLSRDMAQGRGLFDAIGRNPAGFLSTTYHGALSSAPASVVSAGAGIASGLAAGTASANPLVALGAGAAAAGASSQLMEKGSRYVEKLRAAGAPVEDGPALKQWLAANAPKASELELDAHLEALPTAAFDAAAAAIPGAGLGARAARGVESKVAAKIIEGAVEQSVQGGLGAAGSVGSNIVAGEDIDTMGALQEGLGEFISPVEMFGPAARLGRKAFGATPKASPNQGSPVPNQGSPVANQGSPEATSAPQIREPARAKEPAGPLTVDDLLGEADLDSRLNAEMAASDRRQKVSALRALPLADKLARFRDSLDRRGDEARALDREGDSSLSVVEAELRRLAKANEGARRDADMTDISSRMQVVFGEKEDPDFASALALDLYGADAKSSTSALNKALSAVVDARVRAARLDTPLREVRLAAEARALKLQTLEKANEEAASARLTAEHDAEISRLDAARVTPEGRPDWAKFSDDELADFAHGEDASPHLATIAEAQRVQDADPDYAEKPRGTLANAWRADAAAEFDSRMRRRASAADQGPSLRDLLLKGKIQLPAASATYSGELRALRKSFTPGEQLRIFRKVADAADGDTMLERLAERLTVDEGFSFLQSSGADLLDAVSRSARGEDIRPDWNSEVNEPGVEYARRDDGEPQYPVRESEAPRDATPAAGTYSRRDGSSFRQEGADVRGRINVDRASGRPGRSGGYDDGRGSGALPVEVLALSTEVRESLNFRTRQGEAMGVPHPLEAAASREHFVDAVVRDRRISSIFRALVAKEVSAASLVGLKIDGPRDFAVAAAAFRNPLFERVGVAILDKERRVVRAEITGVGNVISSNVGSERIKQILEENQGAAGFMIWHNHPSGNPDPSDQDFRATRGFEQMGESLGVPFLDHIITNGDKFYSFDEGRIGSMETTRPSWEVAKRGALKSFTERELLIDFARSVRAKDSTGTLVFLVNVRKDVVGVEIVTNADDIPALSRQIGRSALREGATSVMLDGAVATMRERVQILEKSLAEDYGVHLDDASHVAGGGFQTLRESYSYLPQYGEISLNSRRKVAAERELAAGNDEVSESKRARKSDAEKLAYRKERLANAEQAFADAKREVSAWYKDKEAGFDSDREELQDSMARQRAAERELRNARLTLEQFEANTGKASATPSPKDGDRKDAARDTEADTFPLAESERDIAARRLGTAQTELTKLQEMGKKIGGESYKNAPVYKQALAERDAAFAAVTELSKSAPAAKADRLAEMSAEREKLFRELNEGQPSPEEAAAKQARLAELNREIKAAERAGAKSKTPADWNPEKFDASTWAMRLAGDDITSIPGREHFSQLGENRIGELETELKGLRDKANAPRIDTILANLRQLQRDRRTRGAPAQVSSPSREEVVEARAAAEDISAERMAKAERRLKRREDMSAGDNAELLADLRPREVDVDGEDFVATDAFALVDSGATLEAMEPSAEDMQALRELDSVVDAATPKARALDREAAAESSAQSERAGNLAEIDREGGGSPPGQKPSDGTGEFPDRGDAGPVRQVGAQTTDTKQSNGFFGPLLEFAKGFSGVVPEIPRGAMHLKGIVNGYKSLIRGQEVSVHQATEEVRKILAPIISLKTPVDAAMRKAAFEARRKQNASQAKLTAATQSGDAGGVAKYAAEVKARSAEVDALLESAKDQPLVIFENFILWRDLMHRAATLKRDDGSPITLPFGVNPAEVRRQAKVWSDRVKASPDSAAIRESIRLHEQSVLATWEDFKSRTLPVDGVWNGGRAYYPHIIPEKASGRPDRVRRSATADFRAYLTNPVGWTKAIETDYAKAMFLHLAAVRADNLHQDVVRRDFASLDETESMEAERKALRAAGKDVPGIEAMARQRGLVPFDAGDAMRYALVPTVDRYALSKALGRILDDGPLAPQLEALQKQGISIPATAFKEALAVAEKKPWFVPPEAAEALSAIEKQEQPGKNEELKRAAEYVNRYWKKYTLFFPHNYIRYEFNNTVADTGKLAAVDPGAFRQIRPAFKEVRAFFRGEPVSAETAAAFRLGVFDTPTVKEVEDLADIPEFSEKLRTDGERLMSNIKGWAGRDWNKFSKYREATYRLAKYNADLERLRKGETPVYGGAYWKDIETIQESEKGAGDRNERRAAAISLATMNDSASVSRSGAQLRRYLIPFYSFTENNLRYHLNLFRNLRDMTARGDMTRTEATTLGAKATASLTARAAVGIASRAVFPMLALAIYNAQVGGEDELSEEDRRRLHVNLGKDDQGRRRVLYLENDFAQVLRWFGGNRAMGNVIEVMSGRQTLETASKDWADNLIPDVLNTALSVGPLVRAGVIAGTGREIGMDVTSPRTVHGSDKTWALVKEAVGIVPADMLRSAFDKDYVSGRDAGDWLKQIVLQIRKRDPESWAYYKIRDDAEAFLEERKGVSTDRGARSSPDQIALRSFRRAIFKGNIDDALGLYDRLLKYGYTAQRLQSSLRSMDPLSSLGKEDGSRRAFVEQLDEQGRKDLDRARLYAERYQVLQGKERILFPREIKGNPAAQERLMERFKDDPRKREILQSLLEEQANQSAAERQLDAALAARRSMKGAR